MLGLLIVLYGLEGLHLHAPVLMVQKGTHFREMCISQRGGLGKFSLEQEPKVVEVDVLNAVKLF